MKFKTVALIILAYIVLAFYLPIFPHVVAERNEGCDMVGKNCGGYAASYHFTFDTLRVPIYTTHVNVLQS